MGAETNGTQAWIAEGGYEDIARDVFRRASGFGRSHLEFDDECSGSFEPLRHLPDDKVAVLGLVSSKWTALEDPELLRGRSTRRADFIRSTAWPSARSAASPRPGRSPSSPRSPSGRKRTRLRLVDTARAVWS